MIDETYFLLLREQAVAVSPGLWVEIGDIPAGYPEKAVEIAAETHGDGEYMVISSYGKPQRFMVTPQTGFVIEKVGTPEPTFVEQVQGAAG